MRSLCTILSLSRIWLAVAFCQERILLRLLIICGAMISDVLDGYLARRYRVASRFGSMIDPLTDKIFIFVCVGALFWEGALPSSHLLFILSRDIFLLLFAIYLSFVKGWEGYDCRALLFGKIFTIIQFVILLAVTLGVSIPTSGLVPLIALSVCYFFERVVDYKKQCLG